MAALRVMVIGTPQWLAIMWGNANWAKIPTVCCPLRRKNCHYARSDWAVSTGLRRIGEKKARWMGQNEEAHVGKLLLRFWEGSECNSGTDEILWHRWEIRRKTEKTNLILSPWEAPDYSKIFGHIGNISCGRDIVIWLFLVALQKLKMINIDMSFFHIGQSTSLFTSDFPI